MTVMAIVLTAAQATQVQGASAAKPTMSALVAAPLTDGRFILGVDVLADPTHAEHWPLLSTLPQVTYASIAALVPVKT